MTSTCICGATPVPVGFTKRPRGACGEQGPSTWQEGHSGHVCEVQLRTNSPYFFSAESCPFFTLSGTFIKRFSTEISSYRMLCFQGSLTDCRDVQEWSRRKWGSGSKGERLAAKSEGRVVLRTPPTSPASFLRGFTLKNRFYWRLASVCCKTKRPLGGTMAQGKHLFSREAVGSRT